MSPPLDNHIQIYTAINFVYFMRPLTKSHRPEKAGFFNPLNPGAAYLCF
uniref:Uncharacterized protein n=1 Tax=Anguilla anguilla TaxID=7936 RepID=A0A0E9W2T4_ANGAN